MEDNKNYSIGDFKIEYLNLISQRGVIDLTSNIISASIYESIFTPGTVCDIDIIDTRDLLGNLILSGDEIIQFSLSVPGSITANFIFSLYELAGLETSVSQKSKTYTLKCVSIEAMYAKSFYVQKSYVSLCSEIVKDIHYNYLNSTKEIVLEDTIGPQNILIPHKNPYDAINLVRKRSVSPINKSSSYVYFENRQNEQQTYNFITIESIFRGKNIIKSFKQSSAINSSFFDNKSNNIISYRIPHQFSSIDKIALGGPRKITTYNFTTQEFISSIVETSDSSFASGGNGTDISSAFKNLFYKAQIPPQSIIPIDISQRASTNIPFATPNLQAYLSVLNQNSMKIRVPGDTILTSGILINCDIPNKLATTGPIELDPLLSGTFLVSRIHHKIGLFHEKPRYTCIMECLKGNYNESVQ